MRLNTFMPYIVETRCYVVSLILPGESSILVTSFIFSLPTYSVPAKHG